MTDLPVVDLPLLHRGKVRDVYEAGEGHLLIVASDRISAHDVVMDEPVPDKGRLLTGLSSFWFDELADVAPNHVVSTELRHFPAGASHPALAGRTVLCRRAEMLPIECIVRGYLSGTAWKEYRTSGTVHGMSMPAGLRESERLPEPIFTPSIKADVGEHDENISYDRAVDMVGTEVAEEARRISMALFEKGSAMAAERGIIIADTKFELGFVDGVLTVADEVLTPDSSRFWPADEWEPGSTPPSFDKQPLRDWLDGLDWDKQPPPPALPADVVAATRARYVAAYERITGAQFDPPTGV